MTGRPPPKESAPGRHTTGAKNENSNIVPIGQHLHRLRETSDVSSRRANGSIGPAPRSRQGTAALLPRHQR